jgi:hypothetical protein
VSFASRAIFPAPPASGADLVDRHWAVDAMPSALRLATLAAAERATEPIRGDAAREATHTLATAYELAALLGRDALRSASPAATPTLERDALRVGAARAVVLHRALGFEATMRNEAILRHAVRLCALSAVAGPTTIAQTRQWLADTETRHRLTEAENHGAKETLETTDGPGGTALWVLWRELLLNPDRDAVERIMTQIATMREQRRGVTDLSPSTNEAELRVRFQLFVRERLADAAGLLAVGLRGRRDAHAITSAITAECTAARSASTGDPNLDLLAAWLELAALSALAARGAAAAI